VRPGASKSPGPREEDLSPPEPAAGKPPVELKITGIVWEEDKQARRAFVNGIVASEGSVVEGAKVVEIRPNSVRFSKGGRNFEVPMFQ
jgi:type II secretory pathway component PulC